MLASPDPGDGSMIGFGYQRSSDVRPTRVGPTPPSAIRREAEARLRRRGYSALREIRCDVRPGELRLVGRLPSQYLKQVALAAVADVEGFHRIVNQIEVVTIAGRGDLDGPGRDPGPRVDRS